MCIWSIFLQILASRIPCWSSVSIINWSWSIMKQRATNSRAGSDCAECFRPSARRCFVVLDCDASEETAMHNWCPIINNVAVQYKHWIYICTDAANLTAQASTARLSQCYCLLRSVTSSLCLLVCLCVCAEDLRLVSTFNRWDYCC